MMNVTTAFVALNALIMTPAIASSFSECQLEATRGLATALLTNDIEAASEATAKQQQCRNLITAEDKEQVEIQNRINKIIRDAVNEGSFDPLK